MTMTLAQVAWKLGELAREGAVRYDACDMAVMCLQMADAVTAHLSQPQPVAQGEAVAWQRRDRIPHGGGDAPGWSHWREVGRYEFAEHNGKYSHIEFRELYATPPIPTGHRAVPVEPDEEFIQMLRGRAQFLRDRGEVKSPSLLEWAANLLAASPSAGGV